MIDSIFMAKFILQKVRVWTGWWRRRQRIVLLHLLVRQSNSLKRMEKMMFPSHIMSL